MKKITFLFFFIFWFCIRIFSQQGSAPANVYNAQFQQVYINYPAIPKGMLEAISFCNTRFTHLTHLPGEPESCI